MSEPKKTLKVLIAEDNPRDAELLVRELERAGYAPEWERVDTEQAYLARLNGNLDLVLSDHAMPQFSGLRAVDLLQESGLDVPLIIVSGTIGEDMAVSAMKHGATDYLLKDRLARLGSAVSQAMDQARLRRERKVVNAGLKRANERYRALASRLETIREQERTHIAREIHDVLAQELTRLKIDLVWLAKKFEGQIGETARPALAERIAGATAQVDTAITTVQRIATELRPVILDSLGLPAAIEWLAEDFARRTGLVCTADVPRGESALSRERATAIFRILQESLTNVVRHAHARTVEVALTEEEGAATLTVRDNGQGISAAQIAEFRSIGLLGMRERAEAFGGTLDIRGEPGPGTTVTVRIPICDSELSSP